MARYYWDSSALVKRYHRESGSEKVEQLLATQGDRFFVSRLALVELHSCFARLVRERIVTNEEFRNLVARLNQDVVAGLLTVVALSGPRLDAASHLLGTQGLASPMRSLDALHLATAEALNNRTRLAALVAADKRLLETATARGLTVLDVG